MPVMQCFLRQYALVWYTGTLSHAAGKFCEIILRHVVSDMHIAYWHLVVSKQSTDN